MPGPLSWDRASIWLLRCRLLLVLVHHHNHSPLCPDTDLQPSRDSEPAPNNQTLQPPPSLVVALLLYSSFSPFLVSSSIPSLFCLLSLPCLDFSPFLPPSSSLFHCSNSSLPCLASRQLAPSQQQLACFPSQNPETASIPSTAASPVLLNPD